MEKKKIQQKDKDWDIDKGRKKEEYRKGDKGKGENVYKAARRKGGQGRGKGRPSVRKKKIKIEN